MHRAIQKYGWPAFQVEILEDNIIDQKVLDEREMHWIKHFCTLAPHGYNLTEGGRGKGLGRLPQSLERRLKISKALTGRKLSESTKQKLAVAHRKLRHTSDIKNKIGQSRARNWKITFPNGETTVIKNLAAYCRDMDTSAQAMILGCGKCKNYKCEKVST